MGSLEVFATADVVAPDSARHSWWLLRIIDGMHSNQHNLQRVFQHGFSVQDIAQPLISFDDFSRAERVKAIMESKRCEVAGIRTDGVITAFVEKCELGTGRCSDTARPINASHVVCATLPLAEMIVLLNTTPRLFVRALGQLGGLVTRNDLLQPAARMWLFGIVTLVEMRFSRMIELHCPEDAWKSSLSAGRIEKANLLLAERSRRNQRLTLADCLQFSDKAQIIARNEQLRQLTRFASRRQIEEMGKRLEKLRNNLAHSQDIVTDDWETILLLSENLNSVLDGPPGMATLGGE